MTVFAKHAVSCDAATVWFMRVYTAAATHEKAMAATKDSREERNALRVDCLIEAEGTYMSAKEARRLAAAAGWVRLRETTPVGPGSPVQKTKHYDVCPPCALALQAQAAEALAERHADLDDLPTPDEIRCSEDTTVAH